MALIKKYYGLFLLIFTLVVWGCYKAYQTHEFKKYFQHPKVNDIYVFQFKSVYVPYKLDTFTVDSFFFFSHPFQFSEAVPKIGLIEQDSFNHNIYYIYSRSELKKLLKDCKIAKIYRNADKNKKR